MYRELDIQEAWELHCLGAPVEREIINEEAPYDGWSPLSVHFPLGDSTTFEEFQDCYNEDYAAIFRVLVE
jgi:hypothetical protein